MRAFITLLLAGAILTLTGCATSYKPGVYQSGQVQQAMKVKLATVIEVREVDIATPASGSGAAAGSATGAVLGTSINSRGGIVAGIAGAVVGGVAGTVAEKAVNAKKGVEILYQIDGSADMMAVVQEQDENPIQVGDRIRIMEGSFATRAVKIPKV